MRTELLQLKFVFIDCNCQAIILRSSTETPKSKTIVFSPQNLNLSTLLDNNEINNAMNKNKLHD